MGPIENTGLLCYRNADSYGAPDVTLKFNEECTVTTRLPASFFDRGAMQISDWTAYIIIKTYFQGENAPEIEVHPLSRRLAKFKDPRYGSASVTLEGSRYWKSVDVYFPVSDPENINYITTNHFDYLNVKDDAALVFADSMFERVPAMAGGGGGGGDRKLKSSEAEALLPGILRIDEEFRAKLAAQTKSSSAPRSTRELGEFVKTLLVAEPTPVHA